MHCFGVLTIATEFRYSQSISSNITKMRGMKIDS